MVFKAPFLEKEHSSVHHFLPYCTVRMKTGLIITVMHMQLKQL